MPITSDLTPRPDFNADENLAHLTEALAPFGFTAGSGKAAESGLSFRVSVRAAGGIAAARAEGPGLVFKRKAKPVAASDDARLLLLFAAAGTSEIAEGKTRLQVTPGSFVPILDGEDLRITTPAGSQIFLLSLPLAAVPKSDEIPRRQIPKTGIQGSGWASDAFIRILESFFRAAFLYGDEDFARAASALPAFLPPVIEALPMRRAKHPSAALGTLRTTVLGIMTRRRAEKGLSLEEIASDAGVTTRYITEAFRDAGTTAMNELVRIRVEAAAADLRDPELSRLPLRTISDRNGFATQQHFSRAFRLRFGVTPNHWKKGEGGAV